MGKRPVRIECKLKDLSKEGHLWLQEECQDLVWTRYSFRDTWVPVHSPYGIPKINGSQANVDMIYQNLGYKREGDTLLKREQVDAVFFASNKDAIYFKMRFL